LVQILWAENVLARRYYYPGCHRMEPYRSYSPDAGLLLPATEHTVKQIMSLPTGSAVHVEDVQEICHVIELVVSHADLVNVRLNQITCECDEHGR
jgi:dTDP-4-amino-4,6-dideoxygalactose transaminase